HLTQCLPPATAQEALPSDKTRQEYACCSKPGAAAPDRCRRSRLRLRYPQVTSALLPLCFLESSAKAGLRREMKSARNIRTATLPCSAKIVSTFSMRDMRESDGPNASWTRRAQDTPPSMRREPQC